MFYIFEESTWNHVKIFHEVRSKFWLKYSKFHLNILVSWTCLHKFITWNPSIFRKFSDLQYFRSHWDLWISCWKFSLNYLASWWKFGTKLWKNVNFPTLRKNFEVLEFWLFNFLMKKLHILTCLDGIIFLKLNFDQKVKVWLFSVQLIFDQLTGKFICQIGRASCRERV